MKKYILCCVMLMLLAGRAVRAQESYNDRAQKYIAQYAALAILEQKRSGVPAAITLGQGILETEAGASELMVQANNHFGIKCKSDWQGDKFLHTDDAPNECFKRYKCAEESYKDHSDYLHRNPRYMPLFTIKQTDYKSWAVCLRKCGYATNPQYAQNLVKIIETFNLQDYTLTGLDSTLANHPALDDSEEEEETTKPGSVQSVADSARNFIMNKHPAPPVVATHYTDSSKVTTVNEMKAFYAHKGESLLQYAVKYKVHYAHLLEMNDLPDGPLPFSTWVYLEKKQTLGIRPTHIVKEGECLLLVSQIEGVQLKKLMAMNMLNPNEEPVTGATLYLQYATAIKPEVKVGATTAHKANAIEISEEPTPKQDDGYIATKPVVAPPVSTPAVVAPKPVAAPATTPTAVPTSKPVVTTTQPAPIDTPKTVVPEPKHVIVVKTEQEAPKQPVVQAYTSPKATPPAEKQDTTTEEEFTKLKADLDKVVYADDSKLLPKTTNTAQPQPKAADTKSPEIEIYYTVKHGDTAFSIAKRNNITVDQLLKWNDITASGVKAGKSLRVK